ncbi:uncharacterized protein H6S33_009725 [Morchella sextelata]|uniref:uncharacterized protein n=1 Tax=Morchella sextelata TaxID=1174677 RepID=UPI001D05421E|nr:uncharacterized protein H6S33_009725 [Morchella sextelata]KAH0613345.1 hypothetical protein H6S33_009725 [Morchella sextelata]
MAASTPSGAPSSKEKKYDRQLRLWGANGQNRLESAHIALFNASAAGCEILKNLILPGVGQFTVIDDKLVEEADLGANFFLDEESLGKPRAERTAALLGELNPDVKGNYLVDSLSNILSTKPELLNPRSTSFTHIVIISPVPTPLLLQIPIEIPVFLVNCVGLLFTLRISAPLHTIVEAHPESLVDLRLLNPWPELSALAAKKTKNLEVQQEMDGDEGMSDHEHGHVPYLILLLKYLDDWKRRPEGDGTHPSGYKEMTAFRSFVQAKMRTHVPGGSEENYEEAVAAVLKHVRKAELSENAKTVLDHPACANISSESTNFWIIAKAVKQFLESPEQGNGLLPLSGGIPDMKAESNDYVALQNVYKNKSRQDASLVQKNVQSTLSSIGREPSSISLEEIELFCRHANFLRAISFRPFSAELSTDDFHKEVVKAAFESWDADSSLINDYVAFRAFQEFITRSGGRAPGDTEGPIDEDTAEMRRLAKAYLSEVGCSPELTERTENIIGELVRYGGAELHNIASLVGGLVAQEVIKV